MYIVGTSGHIDHGKTSLIQSLTGVDCDRLPEEKEREMTIDIGFASIEYPRFGTVGVIDVPGHERFIRNMVAGAWGVDIALLVIAVDDGWMPQTEDHFRVLRMLGVERIIAVLTKTDLGDEEMTAMVIDEVREKLAGSPYAEADIARVSSRTGAGIPELKELIAANLRKLSRAADARKPYLFVDRVFAARGHGTVVTGTLKNGAFREDDAVTVLPGGRSVRIKRIESHHSELAEGGPSQRTALNLAGVGVDELGRGSVVARGKFFTPSAEIIVRIQFLEGRRSARNNLGIELLIGTADITGKLIVIPGYDGDLAAAVARIKLDREGFFYPGQPFVITNPGGFRIVGGGMVLFPGYDAARHRRAIGEALGLLNTYTREELILLQIAVPGWMPRTAIHELLPDGEKQVERMIQTLVDAGSLVSLGDCLFAAGFYGRAITALADAVGELVGPNMQEAAHRAGVDPGAVRLLMPVVMQERGIIEKEGRYFGGDAITEETLPDDRRRLLERIRERALEGIELERVTDDQERRALREMIKLGFLVSLDGNIVYARMAYEECLALVMALFDGRDKITVPEAKDATGLSRKFIIPLLNRIENDGLIKRLGDFRIKV